jgi:hypothetical protein
MPSPDGAPARAKRKAWRKHTFTPKMHANIHPREEGPLWVPSRRRLEWQNGAVGYAFSAEDPEQLRGPQFEAAWCDELAKWRYADLTFEMLRWLGQRPAPAHHHHAAADSVDQAPDGRPAHRGDARIDACQRGLPLARFSRRRHRPLCRARARAGRRSTARSSRSAPTRCGSAPTSNARASRRRPRSRASSSASIRRPRTSRGRTPAASSPPAATRTASSMYSKTRPSSPPRPRNGPPAPSRVIKSSRRTASSPRRTWAVTWWRPCCARWTAACPCAWCARRAASFCARARLRALRAGQGEARRRQASRAGGRDVRLRRGRPLDRRLARSAGRARLCGDGADGQAEGGAADKEPRPAPVSPFSPIMRMWPERNGG